MKIKTTEEILKEKEDFISQRYEEHGEWTNEMEAVLLKKWVAVDDVIKMLKDWNCRNDKTIKRTINTIIMRIEEGS